jgi:PKD repeat protein
MLKTIKIFSLLLALSIVVSSCKKKSDDDVETETPVANFSYTFAVSDYAPAQVVFTNTSVNATSYLWDFGDGNTSPVFSGSHNYTDTAGGDYTVTLTATGQGGSNSVSTVVHINHTPTIAKITSISATTFPLVDGSGNSWDSASGAPDIYFKIFKGTSTNLVANYDSLVENNRTTPPVTLGLTNYPFQIASPDFNTIYYIAIYDKETSPPDSAMGTAVGFQIADYTGTHPSYFDKTWDNSIVYRVTLSWQ